MHFQTSSYTICKLLTIVINLHSFVLLANCGIFVFLLDVSTTTFATCTDGELRLVNGGSDLKGRVEVCQNHAWGTVCDELFGVPEAQVICQQLGFASEGT